MQSHNKFNAKKTDVGSIRFDSRKEADRWMQLRLMERAGEIKDLKRQVRVEIVPKTDGFLGVWYIADFVYWDNRTGEEVWEDVKGYKRSAAYQIFRIKQKLMYWRFGIKIREI